MINIVLRSIGIAFFVGRYVYWVIKAKQTESILPKTKRHLSFYELFSRYVFLLIQILIVSQLLGLHILNIGEHVLIVQVVGLFVLSLGVGICYAARRELDSNWVSGEEYQVKQHQKLVTSGLYGYIRHPIYLGIALSFIGAEMVAGSYLFLAFLPYIISGYFQAKREEKILLVHFGQYKEYMRRTSMFIPHLI